MILNLQLFGGRGASSQVNARMNTLKLMHDTAKINPNYSTGEKNYRQNCQSCTLAFILREKGEDAVALAGTGNSWRDGNGNRLHITEMFNNNPQMDYYIVGQRRFDSRIDAHAYALRSGYSHIYKLVSTKNSIFANSVDVIENEVRKWGNGASGFVNVEWKGNKGGHVFNIKNINGDVIAIDAQSGKVRDLKTTLSHVKPQYTYITRTDNLKVNQKLKKYMVKGA